MGFGDWWAWKGSPRSRGVKREFHMGVDSKDGKFSVSCREISNTRTFLAVANPPHLQEIVPNQKGLTSHLVEF